MLDGFVISSIPFHIQDLFGTFIFGITGGMKAIEHKLDIVGVIVLSDTAGLAGGIIRDVVLGRTPPIAIIDPSYIIIASIAGISILLLYQFLKNLMKLFLTFDVFGLGIFSLLGANIAYSIFGFNLIIMIVSGIITAVGGGVLRDIFVNEIPLVFKKELYVSLSFAGVLLFFIMLNLGMTVVFSTMLGIIFITSCRIAAIKYNWNLPTRIFGDTN